MGSSARRSDLTTLSREELHLWEITRLAVPGLAAGKPIPMHRWIDAQVEQRDILIESDTPTLEQNHCHCEVCTSPGGRLVRLRSTLAHQFNFPCWASVIDGRDHFSSLSEGLRGRRWAGGDRIEDRPANFIDITRTTRAVFEATDYALFLSGSRNVFIQRLAEGLEIVKADSQQTLQISLTFEAAYSHVSLRRDSGKIAIAWRAKDGSIDSASVAHELAHLVVEVVNWIISDSAMMLTPWVGRWREVPAIYIEQLLAKELDLLVPPGYYTIDREWVANGLYGLGLHSTPINSSTCLRDVSAGLSTKIDQILGVELFAKVKDPVLGSLPLLKRNGNWEAHALGILHGRASSAADALRLISSDPRIFGFAAQATAGPF
jgi:hypothetical protein